MLKHYYGFPTVSGSNRLPKEIRRTLKDIYLDEHPYDRFAGEMPSMLEGPHFLYEDEGYVEFGFAYFPGMSNDEINEEFDTYWVRRIYSDYDCTSKLFTWYFEWKRNPELGDGVVSYVHRMRLDI